MEEMHRARYGECGRRASKLSRGVFLRPYGLPVSTSSEARQTSSCGGFMETSLAKRDWPLVIELSP